jgi:hypothetical protein
LEQEPLASDKPDSSELSRSLKISVGNYVRRVSLHAKGYLAGYSMPRFGGIARNLYEDGFDQY